MVEAKGPTPQGKPKRRIRNYLLDRRFQFKYALLLSGASALLMAVMGALLYVRMQDSERRLQDEARFAHAGISAEADAAALMVRREMEVSAQQLINRQLPCVAPPACPPGATGAGSPGVVTESSGAACDPEACKAVCEMLGMQPAPGGGSSTTDPNAPAPAADPNAPAPAAAPDPNAAVPPATVESVGPPEPATPQGAEEQERQRGLIRKIEETVREETASRAQEMESETRTRLATLDNETQKRMSDLRSANQRDLRAILVALIIVFVVLVAIGIVVTHKVVGPIYRMKMLVSKIDGDHLMLQGKLRKGDELQDLFEEVQWMLDRLRDHQGGEIKALSELLDRLRSCTEANRAQVVADLEKFRDRMTTALDTK